MFQSEAVSTDPETGLKIFSTRAARKTDKIGGKGYSAISDESLKILPDSPAGAVFSAQEQEKYRKFKEERIGSAEYISMELQTRATEPPRHPGGQDIRMDAVQWRRTSGFLRWRAPAHTVGATQGA